MFICICNAIKDVELREAALACDGDVDGVYKLLGRIPQCRQCVDDAEEIITEERHAKGVGSRKPPCLAALAALGAMTDSRVGA